MAALYQTSNTKKTHITRTLFFFLLALNIISLFTYVLLPHPSVDFRRISAESSYHSVDSSHLRQSNSSKPWPILPSYLPWWPATEEFESCEAYFGNGFAETADVVPRNGLNGWFRCHYSTTLESSICEGGRVRIDPGRIEMSNGGERIEKVVGRTDDEELPKFQAGACSVRVDGKKRRRISPELLNRYLPHVEDIERHTMRELIGSIEFVNGSDEFNCSQWIEEPTLLVTRFENANVFHRYTDWSSSLPTRPQVVFVDGHSKTQLEETWEALFSGIKFAKHFKSPVCFHHAVFVPLGYETAWFKGLTYPIECDGTTSHDLLENPDDQKTARLSEFGEMITASLNFPPNKPINRFPNTSSEYINILFVRRENYIAHPRHNGTVQSRLINEQQVFEALKIWASEYERCQVNLINALFAHMLMREQIRAIRDASVIVGAHGAGLTHMVSAGSETKILEIISKEFRRPHFALISQWRGLNYRAILLPDSYANPNEVIRHLRMILSDIGC